MKVFITNTIKGVRREEDFSSLRVALEWAKAHKKTELYLTKVVVKEGE